MKLLFFIAALSLSILLNARGIPCPSLLSFALLERMDILPSANVQFDRGGTPLVSVKRGVEQTVTVYPRYVWGSCYRYEMEVVGELPEGAASSRFGSGIQITWRPRDWERSRSVIIRTTLYAGEESIVGHYSIILKVED